MEITHKNLDGIVSISLVGRLDAATSTEAEKEFNTELDSGKELMMVNLSGLEYISSAGLRVLLVLAKRIQQKGGKIVLAGLTAGVKEVFEISGFSSIFKIFETESDSIDFLKN